MTSPRPSADTLKRRALDHARNRLAEGGADHVKARDIAKAIGVSVGTVYNLFGDLDQVIFAVNAEVYDTLLARVRGALTAQPETASARENLTVLAQAYLEFVAENADLWASVLAFNRRPKTDVPDWYRDRERGLFDALRDVMAPMVSASTAPHRDLAPQALWAAVHGILSVSVGRDGLLATQDEIAAQIDLVVQSITEHLERV